MAITSHARQSISHPPFPPILVDGDHLDQPTFHKRYEDAPESIKAELIGGVVYMASPVPAHHGRCHARLAAWLSLYADSTPGSEVFDNTTLILGPESEVQPDLMLRLASEFGGLSRIETTGLIHGPCELVVEIAYSSASIDLHAKKRDYERLGIREYLVLRVDSRTATWFHRGKSGFTTKKPDSMGRLRSRVFPGLWLDAEAVFDHTTVRLRTALLEGLASPEHAAFVNKLQAKRLSQTEKSGPLTPSERSE